MEMVRLTGFNELEHALRELPKATGKNVLRRIGKGSLEEMRAMAESRAPEAYGDLKRQIVISSSRTSRVGKKSTTRFVGGRFLASASTGIDMAMGPSTGNGVLNYASFVEFGTIDTPAFGYMRAAWDSHAHGALEYIKDNLRDAIFKAVGKRRAKLGI